MGAATPDEAAEEEVAIEATDHGDRRVQSDVQATKLGSNEPAASVGQACQGEEAGTSQMHVRGGRGFSGAGSVVSFAEGCEGGAGQPLVPPPPPTVPEENMEDAPPPPQSAPPELPPLHCGPAGLGAAMRRPQGEALVAEAPASAALSPSPSTAASSSPPSAPPSPRQRRHPERAPTTPCMQSGEEPQPPEKAGAQSARATRASSTPSPSARDMSRSLYESVMRLDVQRVRDLLAAGAQVNAPCRGPPGMPSYVTLLHSLSGSSGTRAPHDSLTILDALIRARANLNPRSSDGSTPLIVACAEKNIGAAECLLKWGADISPVDDYGYDCLTWAAVLQQKRRPSKLDRHRSHVVAPVADEKADSQSPPQTPNPIGNGSISAKLVQMLLDVAAKVEAERNCRARPNSIDWEHGMLLGHAEKQENTLQRASPLLVAVMQANHEAAAVLLENGMTPVGLHDAVRIRSLELVKVLLSARADPLGMDENGETPMDIALQANEDSMIRDTLREAVPYSGLGPGESPELSVHSPNRRATRSKERSNMPSRLKIPTTARQQAEGTDAVGTGGDDGRGPRLLRCLPACVSRCFNTTATCIQSWGEELSRPCRQLCRNQIFQGVMFSTILGALFIPDMWVIFGVSDTLLDVILVMLLIAFVVELLLQALGLRCAYLKSFFFFTDLLGASSLLLDLVKVHSSGSGSSVEGNAVIMRAARASRLGARVGRFTKLIKLLRFLHGSQEADPAGDSTAKGLTSVLVTRLSILVSCLIITLMFVLPLFELIKYPEQDWAMQMWVAQLAAAIEEGVASTEVNTIIQDFRSDFYDRGCHLHRLKWRNRSTEVLLWHLGTKLRPDNELQVISGNVTAMFDVARVNRTEALASLATIVFTILLLVGFTTMMSKSVSEIALKPLELILSKVRQTGSTIYRSVENMHERLGFESPAKRSDESHSDHGNAWEDYACETALLDAVVRKLAVLSEITMQKTKPNDMQTLQYLGEVTRVGEDPDGRQLHTPPRTPASREDVHRGSFQSSEYREETLEAFGEEHCAWKVCSWDFNPLGLKLADTCAICSAIFGDAVGKAHGLDEDKLSSFLHKASSGYSKGPQYHNWHHAVDVAHTLFMLIRRCSTNCLLMSCLEEYALLVSAVCHDIGHPGVTNDFLVQTSSELAICYNDTSPLENMHCARLFEIVTMEDSAIFSTLSKAQYKEVRSICIEAILHTDNKHHVDCVRRLQMFGEMNSELLQCAMDLHTRSAHAYPNDEELSRNGSVTPPCECWPPRELLEAMWAADWRTPMRNALLHFADISNPVRPFHVCRAWAIIILEEFFAQGDLATQRGLPVVALHDREKTNLAFSQIGFIDFFAAPLVFAIVRVLAPLAELVDQLVANATSWAQEWRQEVDASEEEFHNLMQRIRRLEDRSASVLSSVRHSRTATNSILPVTGRRTSSFGVFPRSRTSSDA